MRTQDTQLKNFILDAGLVKKSELEAAQEEVGGEYQTLGQVLLGKGLVDEGELRRIQAHVLGVPFVNLENRQIDFDVLSLIPEPIARNHNVIAYDRNDNELEVAMLDIDDLPTIDFVHKKTNLKITPRLTDSESMKSALVQYQRSLKAEFGDIIEKEAGELKAVSTDEEDQMSEEDLQELAEDLPVVRIVETLLKHAIIQDASDIHVEPSEEEVLVRYRIDGILHDAMKLPARAGPSITARIKVLAQLKLDEKRLPQDGRFKVEMEGEEVSLRVSILPTQYGEKTVMRLLRQNVEGFTLESLGFHGEGLERIHWATKRKTGLILTTGPTGSGKTTTLYTVLDILNTPEVNISTVEDPVEYQMARINQTQVKPQIGFTFSKGLRSLVRQDPDIIMVGEIRDSETQHLSVNAALTGHLVLSTLHTNSAAGTISRLLDMDAEAFLLVSTLKVIIGQRLVRKLCKDKERYTLNADEVEELGRSVDLDNVMRALKAEDQVAEDAQWQDIPFYKPIETDECKSGYSGRTGIHEILKVSDPIKGLIMSGATTEEIEDQAKKEGMLTMLEDGIYKATQGVTSIEEVLRVVSE